MKLLKPDWINHGDGGGKAIFAVDIHPDGSRFASGGQGEDSGKIVIWNISPVIDEEVEIDENVPKMLCQIDDHTGCVNCLRWSNNGTYLASGGDDKTVIIWTLSRNSGSSTVFGTGGAVVNIENWKSLNMLRGHQGDIIDLAWSPDDLMLATGSVDNTVVVWNAQKFPEILHTITGHEGLVKGVTFDPVGKYLASQADDKILCIWKTSDFSLEKKITEPFHEASGTTHALRLNWSPDGQYVVSAHAMNNGGPVAKIIERNGWKSKMDFVGHRKAVTCVRFNERIFTREESSKIQYVCCAIGSKDRAVSIWLTSLKRPLAVINNLFESSVMDISWSKCGYSMVACSLDGTVAYLEFSKEELGKAMSSEDKYIYHKKTYGTSIKASKSLITSSIVENPDILKYQQSKQQQERVKKAKLLQQNMNTSSVGLASPNNKLSTSSLDGKLTGGLKSVSSNEKLDVGDILKKQKESKTKDGKRRIVPMLLEPPCDVVDTGTSLNFCSGISNDSILTLNKSKDYTPNKSMNMSSSKEDSRLITSSPMEMIEQRNSPALPTSLPASLTIKRKCDFSDSSSNKKSKKKKEKEKDKNAKNNSDGFTTPVKSSGESLKTVTEGETEAVTSALSIPYPEAENKMSIQINISNISKRTVVRTIFEVENDLHGAEDASIHYLRCIVDDNTLWETCLNSPITTVSANENIICVACQNNSLHVYSGKGRRLYPGMILDSSISQVRCHKYFVMAITSAGFINVWNIRKRCSVICNESLAPIINNSDSITQCFVNEKGCPVITLSSHHAYIFDAALCCWTYIASASDSLQLTADVGSCISGVNPKGQLQSIQTPLNRISKQMMRGLRMNPVKQETSTLAHLESQVSAALSISSSEEYHFWLMTYVRYIVQAGNESRLRDLCEDLIAKHDSSESRILCYEKKDLLKDMLPIIASNLRFQRFYSEFQQRLEMFSKR